MSEKRIVGITMGDPASIGPEITVKAFADKSLYDLCRPVVVGDACVLEAALPIVGHTEMKLHPIQDVSEAKYEYGTIDVLDMGLVDMDKLKRGEVSAMCGEAARASPLWIPAATNPNSDMYLMFPTPAAARTLAALIFGNTGKSIVRWYLRRWNSASMFPVKTDLLISWSVWRRSL